jgi:GalNAc-alpha-(1->4)-GalNAc-alpha-(1->3)-diNAcBac-PP-undecaprenol alpha-1,4-N-acetyl-D-galactosaminyltransferase
MRIALAIYSLEAGGAERVLGRLASAWAERGEDVIVLTLAPRAVDFYPLHGNVLRVAQGVVNGRGPLRFMQWILWLRRQVRSLSPDVVVSFLDKMNLLVLSATRGQDVPVVVAERIDPRRQPLPKGLELIRRPLYARAAAVVVQTKSVRTWAQELVAPERVWVVPNPVEAPSDSGYRFESQHTLVAAGRLHRQKGFDLLLDAFARVAAKHPDWSLVVFGEGPERAALERRYRESGLEGRVGFPGIVADLPATLAGADLFVLSSRWEGFPNALAEAMAAGLPVVSFDCASGPGEIITQDVNGILVPPEDAQALADAMDRLMSDETERDRMANAAREVAERFSLDKIISEWDELLVNVTTSHRD